VSAPRGGNAVVRGPLDEPYVVRCRVVGRHR